MIKALLTVSRAQGPSRQVLLIGLSRENTVRLLADQPIPFDAAELGLPALPIVIVAGETEDAIQEHVTRSGGYLAEVAVSAAGQDQPPSAPPTPLELAYAAAALAGWNGSGGPDAAAKMALDAAYAARANRSHNPHDAANGYCGACHAFTGQAG